MSSEFCALMGLAVVLISQMYNRLTLVDGYTHKQAIEKIWNDHKNIRGFSRRSISRNLPMDNPNVPRRKRRVMSKWHNNSIPKMQSPESQLHEHPVAENVPNPINEVRYEPILFDITDQDDPSLPQDSCKSTDQEIAINQPSKSWGILSRHYRLYCTFGVRGTLEGGKEGGTIR
jgi:hypothetical protein